LVDQKAAEIARVLGGVRGAVDLQLGSLPGLPQMGVHLRLDRLAQFGLRPVEVLDAVSTAFEGRVVAQTFEENRVSAVLVVLGPEQRRDPEAARALLLRSPEGAAVPLSELADLALDSGRYLIQHDGGRRRQTVTCNVEDRDVASFVEEARQRVAAAVGLPT